MDVNIGAYLLMMGISALCACTFFYFSVRKRLALPSGKALTLGVCVLLLGTVFAVLGAKLFYFVFRLTYILRQGVTYLNVLWGNRDVLLIDEDGDFHIFLAEEHPEKMDKTQVDGKKIVNALCFGPALIKDGRRNENLSAAPTYCEPESMKERMVLCQIGPLEYMVVACAHRGLKLSEMADMILYLEPNVQQAYNLDGGISTQLLFLGRRINNTSIKPEDIRKLVDIVYFASAYQPD